MNRLSAVASAIAIITFATSGHSAAQLRPVLVAGAEISGRMLPGPADVRYRTRDYGFSAEVGQRLVFTMRSSEFDAHLVVIEEGAPYRVLATDDDGGGGSDARLFFTPSKAGRYVLRAQVVGGDDGGTYTVAMAQAD